MSIFSYVVFVTVVEQKGFIRAADILNITPSAVSHSIAQFEKECGFPLLIRDKMGTRLTQNGKLILPYVYSILKSEESLKQTVTHINGIEKGTVKIGTFSSVCVNWIPDIIKSYHALYPDIEIIVYQGGYTDVVNWLNSSSVDLGFITYPAPEELDVQCVGRDRFFCVTPPDFQPKNPDSVTMEEFRDMSFILQRDDYGRETYSLIKKHNINANFQFYVIDDQSLVAMVESGLGVCVVPELVIKQVSANVNVYPIVPAEYRSIGIARMKNQPLSPAAEKMYQHIISCASSFELRK